MRKVKIAQDKMDANTFAIHRNISDELFQNIVSKLKPNQWLHSTEKNDLTISELNNVKETKEFAIKPNGLYFSKGDWLFFDYSYSENEIYIADIDYSKIKVVADENDLFDFIQKYVNTRRLVNRKQIRFKLLQDEGYAGFCILPDPRILLQKLISQNKIKKGTCKSLLSYDVSTLIVWKPKEAITSLRHLMDRKNLLQFNSNSKFSTFSRDVNYDDFANALLLKL